MDSNTTKSERNDIKATAKHSLTDAVSMIICDEADMIVNNELHLNCGKAMDVAERVVRLIANASSEDGREARPS
jgi:hypothetical protein